MIAIECRGEDFSQLAQEVLGRGALLRFRARGHSMHPLIRDGDILTIRSVDAADIETGEVVLFRQGKRVLAHRVIGRRATDELLLVAKGDAHLKPDPPIPSNRLMGRVTHVDRDGKRIDLQNEARQYVRTLLWGRPPFLGSRIYRLMKRAREAVRQIRGAA